MDPVVAAAIVAGLATVAVGLLGPVLGRRWGLPGLGRDIQAQQAALIATLQAEVAELRTQRTDDARRLAGMEACAEELVSMERRLALAERELLDLYRELGRAPLRQRQQRRPGSSNG